MNAVDQPIYNNGVLLGAQQNLECTLADSFSIDPIPDGAIIYIWEIPADAQFVRGFVSKFRGHVTFSRSGDE